MGESGTSEDAATRYTLRRSDRARRARIEVSGPGGVVVVLPRRYPLRVADELVEQRRDWIEAALARVSAPSGSADELPTEVVLPGISERWPVEYRIGERAARAEVRERASRLLVVAPDAAAARALLGRFVQRRARARLAPVLEALASARGLRVEAVSVRAQRSRWASCSATGKVSINRALCFLPSELVELVLVHELCHLRELNHSPRFWALMAEEFPDLAERRAAMRRAWSHVPAWALDAAPQVPASPR
jgi:predicted metal-dependent hydrolase